jgi:hypothetical protein
MTIERNIHFVAGKYRVMLTRRPKNIYGGRFTDLNQARRVRDQLEASHNKGTTAHRAPRTTPYRTVQFVRQERRQAGLCMYCGECAPRPGQVGCDGCYTTYAFKRREARRENHFTPSDARKFGIGSLNKPTNWGKL